MAEMNANNSTRQIAVRHRGRGSQVLIYFGKMLRMFVYQNDWKVLPMAALIAGLVGMVIRNKFFINMEGTLMGSFAMVCVCIWNGCFNSIQVICRERDVIKREHRSGMHVSSYICSHMLYQALLCLGQTFVTFYVTLTVGVNYPQEGLVTSLFALDFIISMFLITYASDMLSLWVSTLAHTTTTAMTIMPFVLIFQLVFSGGMLTLPEWTKPLTSFTISNPALKVIATQADTNHRPYASIASMVTKMKDSEVSGSVSIGQVMDMLQDKDNAAIAEVREKEIDAMVTLGEAVDVLKHSESFESLKQEVILQDFTVEDVLRLILNGEGEAMESIRNTDLEMNGLTLGDLLQSILETEASNPALQTEVIHLKTLGDVMDAIDASGILEENRDVQLGGKFTVGEAVDMLADAAKTLGKREEIISVTTTVGQLIDLVGEDKVKSFLEEKAAEASYESAYEYEASNVIVYWMRLILFVIAFAFLAMITLEFIDKDRR